MPQTNYEEVLKRFEDALEGSGLELITEELPGGYKMALIARGTAVKTSRYTEGLERLTEFLTTAEDHHKKMPVNYL